jgi:hypothetical protein
MVDQLGPLLPACRRVESHARQRVGPKIGDEDIATPQDPAQRCQTGGKAQIKGHELLVAIEMQKFPRQRPGVGWPAKRAHEIALGRLDLDDLCPEISEAQRGRRADHDRSQIKNTHTGEGQFNSHGRALTRASSRAA